MQSAQTNRDARTGPWRGFTLVELLVVIAILSLLASILMPSLRRAVELASRTKCGSNVGVFAKAMTMYSSANNQRFVSCMEWVRDTTVDYGDPGYAWAGANPWRNNDAVLRNGKLWEYIRTPDVYVCPQFAELPYPGKGQAGYGLQFTYSMNGHVSHLWAQNPNQRKQWYQMITDLRHPEKVFLLSEEMPYATPGHSVAGLNDGVLRGESYTAGTARGDALGYLHGAGTVEDGVSNAVFADGHVGTAHIWETYDVTFDPP